MTLKESSTIVVVWVNPNKKKGLVWVKVSNLAVVGLSLEDKSKAELLFYDWTVVDTQR